jgi:hypothetical protein
MSGTSGDSSSKFISSDDFYTIRQQLWYQTKPYAFEAIIDGLKKRFYLPINPQNLTITTHYATTTMATLGSTIEQHAHQRYFDISIAGTTGIAPNNIPVNLTSKDANIAGALNTENTDIDVNENFNATNRKSYDLNYFPQINAAILGGFLSSIYNKTSNIVNRAADIGRTYKFQSGVGDNVSGYATFHNLYRFFLAYKKSATDGKSAHPDSSPLMFLNFKDNNKYSCVINAFTLERSSDNPMLYNYSIQLRAYDLKDLGSSNKDKSSNDENVNYANFINRMKAFKDTALAVVSLRFTKKF